MAVNSGSQSELTIGDFPGIVTEGFTILRNSVHKIIFVKYCVWLSNSNRIARV